MTKHWMCLLGACLDAVPTATPATLSVGLRVHRSPPLPTVAANAVLAQPMQLSLLQQLRLALLAHLDQDHDAEAWTHCTWMPWPWTVTSLTSLVS